MLEKIKLILAINSNEQDALLSAYIDMVAAKLLAYIGQTSLPAGLEGVIVELVASRYRSKGVKSEKIGDYSIEYATYESDKDELKPYESILRRYRGMKVV